MIQNVGQPTNKDALAEAAARHAARLAECTAREPERFAAYDARMADLMCEVYDAADILKMTPEPQVTGALAPQLRLCSNTWRVNCLDCEPEGTGYWIGLNAMDDADKALEWTMHLAEKAWFSTPVSEGWFAALSLLFGRTG